MERVGGTDIVLLIRFFFRFFGFLDNLHLQQNSMCVCVCEVREGNWKEEKEGNQATRLMLCGHG
jgi:hypothetical protein